MNATLAQRLKKLEGELKLLYLEGGGYDLDHILLKENEIWEYKLQDHLRRYWKDWKVIKIKPQSNLLGQFIFRAVYFEVGRVIHLCKRARIQNWQDSWWFINERKVRKNK